jgi:hypothetical protein
LLPFLDVTTMSGLAKRNATDATPKRVDRNGLTVTNR